MATFPDRPLSSSPPSKDGPEGSRHPESKKSRVGQMVLGAILASALGAAAQYGAEVLDDGVRQETRASADKLKKLRELAHSPEVHSVFAPREHTEWELVADAEFGDASSSIPSLQSGHDLARLASKIAIASPQDAYEFITLDREVSVDGRPEHLSRRFRVRRTDATGVSSEQYRVENMLSSYSRLTHDQVDVDGYGRDPEEARKDALLKLVRHIYDKTRELTADFGRHQATPEGFSSDDAFSQDDPRHHERPFQYSRGGSTLQYQVNVFGEPREITFRSSDAVGYVQNMVVSNSENYGTYRVHFRVDWVHDTGFELREHSSGL